ncbi:cysteine and tyrosine-rich protein 1-like [Ylistrum balloti]|uniref:cysteine and tyrosine-rich protein 1-like n=1 Tax=Ylistrum balloti TaxID=509963 RepID=UPI002905C33B|nr:cysteine and tyrosine-rich protein 1-like [Ylistrum balloti]
MASYKSALISFVVTLTVFGFTAADTCYSSKRYYSYIDNDMRYRSDSTYCSYLTGCCSKFGESASCCSSDIYYYDGYYDVIYYSYSLSTAAIAGIVIGCLSGIGIFIAIIVCCCCACFRSTGPRTGGQVLTPVGVGATVVTTQQQAFPQPPPTQPYPGYNPAFVPDSAPTPNAGAAPFNNEMAPPPYANKY